VVWGMLLEITKVGSFGSSPEGVVRGTCPGKWQQRYKDKNEYVQKT